MIFCGIHTASLAGAIPGVTVNCLLRGGVIPGGEAKRCFHEHNRTCDGCRTANGGEHPCQVVNRDNTGQVKLS